MDAALSHTTGVARTSFSKVKPKLQIAWDSVSMGAAKKCWRYYQISIVEGWRPKKESHHLRYGQLYHRAHEVYYHTLFEGKTHDECVRAALWDLRDGCIDRVKLTPEKIKVWSELLAAIKADPKMQTEYDVPAIEAMLAADEEAVWWNPHEHLSEEKAKADPKSVENLFRTVLWYLDKYGKDDAVKTIKLANGKPAVELSFRYELGYTFATGEHLLHSGHIDRMGQLGDDIYFVDPKTTKNTLSGNSSWGWFAQWSPNNQMSGYSFAGKVAFGFPVKGGIIDGAQIAKGFSRFERGFVLRTDDQLAEWRNDFIQYVQLAEMFVDQNYWPMNDTACDHYGGCPLRDICNKDPKVRHIFLQRDFVQRAWDPLEVRGDI